MNQNDDYVSRQAVEDKLLKLCNELEGIFANIRMQNQDESVCDLCEYDCPAPYECPGFDIENCFKLADEIRHEWQSTKDLPPVTPQPKWIPVSERLPEFRKEVLTCSNGGFIEIQSLEDSYDGYWENQKGDWTDFEEITAWMPLPEPYKQEVEE